VAACRQLAPKRHWLPFTLVVSNSALLMVDHVHFQYNGLLLGLLLLSLAAHEAGQVLVGGVLFAVLLNFKHLYLVLAPVQFVYILRSWVCGRGWAVRLLAMTVAVTAVFAASLGPVIWSGQTRALLERCVILSLQMML
jgi:alpha-1,3-glucosyltransferase